MGRWGILGAAAIAEGALIAAILASGNSVVAGIASRSGDRARAMAATHGISAAYDSYEQLLDDPDIEHIYVALPNSLHQEWTVRALRAGKNVLCEKPLATTLGEVELIASVADECGLLAMEAFMYRFNARTAAFVKAAPSPVYVQAVFAYPQPDPGNIRRRRELAGGALMDLGCYVINVVRWLLGEPQGVSATAHCDEVDLSVAATMTFLSGRIATVWSSFETPEWQEVTVVGIEQTARTMGRPFGAWLTRRSPIALRLIRGWLKSSNLLRAAPSRHRFRSPTVLPTRGSSIRCARVRDSNERRRDGSDLRRRDAQRSGPRYARHRPAFRIVAPDARGRSFHGVGRTSDRCAGRGPGP